MAETEAQRRARQANLRKAREANARKKAASGSPPSPDAAPAFAAAGDPSEPVEFDAGKVLLYAVNAPTNALAVLTGRDDMRLNRTEADVAVDSLQTSLELAGATRFVVYAAPIACVLIFLAIYGQRLKMLGEIVAEKRLEREAREAMERGDTFVARHEADESTQQARAFREARNGRSSEAPVTAGNGSIRGISPEEATYLEAME